MPVFVVVVIARLAIRIKRPFAELEFQLLRGILFFMSLNGQTLYF